MMDVDDSLSATIVLVIIIIILLIFNDFVFAGTARFCFDRQIVPSLINWLDWRIGGYKVVRQSPSSWLHGTMASN